MPLSLNEIKDRALAFSRKWEGEKVERTYTSRMPTSYNQMKIARSAIVYNTLKVKATNLNI